MKNRILQNPSSINKWGRITGNINTQKDLVDLVGSGGGGGVPTTRKVNGHALSADVTVTKSDVSLGNCDNTSDLNKPISAATQTALNAKAASSHTHAPSDITGTAVITNDSRLTNARTPTAHTHAPEDITGTAVINSDARLTDARTPTAHSHYLLVFSLANDATTGANTTPISLTGLAFDYAVNSIYRITVLGAVSAAAATTGCGFQIDTTSAVTSSWLQFFHQLANTGTLSGGNAIADDTSQGVSSGIPANAGVYPVNAWGLLRTAGNTGNAQLRFRSETTAAITCKAGTTIVVEKLI